ncbi:mobilizable transposon [Mucinivorans hirudinis]|uniref:Mobilizable transposon n=1 Tax=Mucinivorans hirudinis TaxID=1433126 RepID=A0A060RDL7_9BACT|nr:mobilizable transposon [Mucinivorans hirudinis]
MANGTLTFDQLPQAVETLNKNIESLIGLVNTMSERISVIEQTMTGREIPMDVEEASVLIKRTKGTLYKMVCNKEVPFHKKGNRLIFYKNELLDWLSDDTNNEAGASGIVSTVVDESEITDLAKLIRKNRV